MLWICLSRHPELRGTFIVGDSWNAESTRVLEAVHIEIQNVIMDKIKRNKLSVKICCMISKVCAY
jgi:hypothetical protein